MKRLDWYIIKKFLGTFFFAISLIILIVIVFDISEHVDDFIEKKAPLKAIIFDFYLNFIPYFINLFSPLFTFIAVIFFTSRLAFNTEIVAMLSSGISFKRIMLPYFISASILAIMSFYLSNILIPETNRKRIEFEYSYIKKNRPSKDRNIHKQIEPGTFIYLESFNERTNTGFQFSIEKIEDGKLTYKLLAGLINYDTIKGSWIIENYNERYINGLEEKLKFGQKLDTVLNFKPNDFAMDMRELETMNIFELQKFIDTEKVRGSDNIDYYLVEKHKRIANPFSSFVLTLIGLALSSRKVRGGIGLHLGIGISLSFAFILFMQVSTTFATNGNLPAFIAVWIPNVLFGILGVYLSKKAPK